MCPGQLASGFDVVCSRLFNEQLENAKTSAAAIDTNGAQSSAASPIRCSHSRNAQTFDVRHASQRRRGQKRPRMHKTAPRSEIVTSLPTIHRFSEAIICIALEISKLFIKCCACYLAKKATTPVQSQHHVSRELLRQLVSRQDST